MKRTLRDANIEDQAVRRYSDSSSSSPSTTSSLPPHPLSLAAPSSTSTSAILQRGGRVETRSSSKLSRKLENERIGSDRTSTSAVSAAPAVVAIPSDPRREEVNSLPAFIPLLAESELPELLLPSSPPSSPPIQARNESDPDPDPRPKLSETRAEPSEVRAEPSEVRAEPSKVRAELLETRAEPESIASPSPSTSSSLPPSAIEDGPHFTIVPSQSKVFKRASRAQSFVLKPEKQYGYKEMTENLKRYLQDFLKEELSSEYRSGLKFHLSIEAKFDIFDAEQKLRDQVNYFFTQKAREVHHEDDLVNTVDSVTEKCEESLSDMQDRGSGHIYNSLDAVHLGICALQSTRGGSYRKLPPGIARRLSTINPKSRDDLCIVYCILLALKPNLRHPRKNYNKGVAPLLPFRDLVQTQNVKFPISREDISKLEKQNPISINVYAFEETKSSSAHHKTQYTIYPWRISPRRDSSLTEVNLLLVKDEKDSPATPLHFAFIEDLDRLVQPSFTKDRCKRYRICRYCLQGIPKDRLETIKLHDNLCKNFKPCNVVHPSPGSKFTFDKTVGLRRVSHFSCLDFETKERDPCDQPKPKPDPPLPPEASRKYAWISTVGQRDHVNSGCRLCRPCKPSPGLLNSSRIVSELTAFSFAYKIVSCTDMKEDFPLVLYQGPHCLEVLLSKLKDDMIKLYPIIRRNKNMIFTESDRRSFESTSRCLSCSIDFSKLSPDKKHRHHDHQSGRFLGALCW